MLNVEFILYGYVKVIVINICCFYGNDLVIGFKIEIGLYVSVRVCEYYVDFKVIVN